MTRSRIHVILVQTCKQNFWHRFFLFPPLILTWLSFSPSWLPILIDISSGGRHLVFPPQKIVDDIFGEGEYTVKEGDAWCGVVSVFPFTCFHLNLSSYRFRLAWATCETHLQRRPARPSKFVAHDLGTPDEIAEHVEAPTLCILVAGMGGIWRRESSGKGMLVYLMLDHACLLNIEGLAHAPFVEHSDDNPWMPSFSPYKP